MGYSEIAAALTFPAGASDRYKRLEALDRLLDGTFYDDISYAFEQEKLNDAYLPLTKRRPSVKYNLARIVIDESSGSLWTDDEMAKVVAGIPNAEKGATGGSATDQKNVDAIMIDCALDAVMMELYERSASGSGAIIVDFDDDGMPTFQCLPGKYVRPTWTSTNGSTLQALEYVYPTTAKALRAIGEAIKDDVPDAATYWVRIVYSADAEMHFAPMRAERYAMLGQEDPDAPIGTKRRIAWELRKAYPHDWGVVPAIYVRNLLFGDAAEDGRCPYQDCVDIQVEIARLLSQVGRGFRFAADPLLVRERGEMEASVPGMGIGDIDPFGSESFEQRGPNGETIRSVSNVIEGKAKLLEITGQGLIGTVDYVKVLREWGLEVAGTMKPAADNASEPMSGRALALLQQMLRLLVKRQRIAYGARGLLPLIRVILAGCKNGVLTIQDVVNANPLMRMFCDWPKTNADAEMAEAQAQAELDATRLNSGVIVPNEVRARDDLGPPLPLGDRQFLTGKGPYTGASTLGAKPDDEGDPSLNAPPTAAET